MEFNVKPLFPAQVRYCRLAAAAFALTCAGLAGCSDSPHDRVEAPAPATMTTLPTPAKTIPDKPVNTPVPPPSESEMGIAIYPGAKTYVNEDGRPVKPLTEGNMATALLETADPLDKVLDFYKERIKETDFRGVTTPAAPIEKKDGEKRKVLLTGNDASHNVQVVQLREENGKTVIELMRTSVKALPAGVSDGK